jgi:hypothetical protein
MSSILTVSEMNFGEYDAFNEDAADGDYFEKSFVTPFSFQMNTLRNDKNFIIVGKKGAGKTAAQLYFRKKLERDGYITNFFSFFDGVSQDNYRNLAKTQKIDFLNINIDRIKNMHNYYDFRSIWERVFYIQLSACLENNQISNDFTRFVKSTVSKFFSGIMSDILKSFKIELKIPISSVSAKLSFDPSGLVNNNKLDIEDFNKIARSLLLSECRGNRVYMFVDELVFSKLDLQDDEVKVRSALIRDILRVSHEINRDLCSHKIDIHFICTLRPEIRNFLNDMDAEISKIIDSKDVLLHWNSNDTENNILIDLLKKKIISGAGSSIDIENFFDREINFGRHSQSVFKFMLNNSWHRPRDIVRFLKSYQKCNPSDKRFSQDGIKNSLNEYSRVSAKEIMDELSVNYDNSVILRIKQAIRNQRYEDIREFERAMAGMPNVNIRQLCDDLFLSGVIGNFQEVSGKIRYFWSHRHEEYLSEDMSICVHPGLWNYFNIRHS